MNVRTIVAGLLFVGVAVSGCDRARAPDRTNSPEEIADEDNADLLAQWGQRELDAGNVEKAVEFYGRAASIRVAPEHNEPLADGLVRMGRVVEAAQALEALAEGGSADDRLARTIADLHHRAGDLEAAVTWSRLAASLQPRDPDAWLHLAAAECQLARRIESAAGVDAAADHSKAAQAAFAQASQLEPNTKADRCRRPAADSNEPPNGLVAVSVTASQ